MRVRAVVCLAVVAALVAAATADSDVRGELRGIEKQLGSLVKTMAQEDSPSPSADVALPETGPPKPQQSSTPSETEFVACEKNSKDTGHKNGGSVKKERCTAPQPTPVAADMQLKNGRTTETKEVNTPPPETPSRTTHLDEKNNPPPQPVKEKPTEEILAVVKKDIQKSGEVGDLVPAVPVVQQALGKIGSLPKVNGANLTEIIHSGEDLSKAYGLGDARLEDLAEHTLALEGDMNPSAKILINDMEETNKKKAGSAFLSGLKGSATAAAKTAAAAGQAELNKQRADVEAQVRAQVADKKAKLGAQVGGLQSKLDAKTAEVQAQLAADSSGTAGSDSGSGRTSATMLYD